uniref:Uncharacterized protein n=1 Tax=Glossina austeni TaxID=7395 RepID=A0A1A9UJP8_GLOAU
MIGGRQAEDIIILMNSKVVAGTFGTYDLKRETYFRCLVSSNYCVYHSKPLFYQCVAQFQPRAALNRENCCAYYRRYEELTEQRNSKLSTHIEGLHVHREETSDLSFYGSYTRRFERRILQETQEM